MQITLQELEGIRKMFMTKNLNITHKFNIGDKVKIIFENFLKEGEYFKSITSNGFQIPIEHLEKLKILKLEIKEIIIGKDYVRYGILDYNGNLNLMSEIDLEKIE